MYFVFNLMFLTFVCSITTCFSECPYPEKPKILLQQKDGDRCARVTYDKPTKTGTYYDDERIDFIHGYTSQASAYSAFTGFINFSDNTPQYCLNEYDRIDNFSFIISNNITNKMRAKVEFVLCRSDAFWTDGKDFCIPPECTRYIHNSPNTVFNAYHNFMLNMNDINAVNVSRKIRFLSFDSPSDPRFILNITSNTTEYLQTKAFLALCSKYGPCKKGRFLQRDDIRYAKGGYPTLTMQKDGKSNTLFIAIRHDPRPFVTTARDDPCPIGIGLKSRVCTSAFGTQSFKKLWEIDLPYNREWLSLRIDAKFAYKTNCTIKLMDFSQSGKILADFTGPCGRYSDMKRGNYPIEKVGIFTNSLQRPFKMRYGIVRILYL